MKRFGLSGAIEPGDSKHFYVSPNDWNSKFLLPKVQRGEYTILRGPSQSGKSTRIKALIQTLQREDPKCLPI